MESGYSGQIFFADWLPLMYNAVWTSWQCLFAYALEQDVNDEYVYKYPRIYAAGQKSKYFNKVIFWRWICFSIWHGAVTYFGVIYGMSGPIDSSGLTYSHWYTSSLAFSIIIHIIVLKLFIESVYWNWVSTCTGLICVIIYYASVVILNLDFLAKVLQPELEGEYMMMLTNGKAWICMIVLPAVALIPDLTYTLAKRVFYPTPTDFVMLKQQKHPNYIYDGFDDVYVPPLPHGIRDEKE